VSVTPLVGRGAPSRAAGGVDVLSCLGRIPIFENITPQRRHSFSESGWEKPHLGHVMTLSCVDMSVSYSLNEYQSALVVDTLCLGRENVCKICRE
jgi:hypothetical protein